TKPQVYIELQLAVFFYRLSSTESLFGVCSRFGLGKGTSSSVYDAQIYRNSSFYKNYFNLIQEDDYLL
ncbi:3615_t:CDS:2, partial [Funneliformis geosporum]